LESKNFGGATKCEENQIMGGDYTRWTFNPSKDYSGLFKQQGRVDLDADWNELVETVDRRWRAETIDIIGRAVVPMSTPGAFLIVPSGPGQFTIGVGRMYVDGLLAECHGVSPSTYDAQLGEVNGTAPVPFQNQPYYPYPNPVPSGAGSTDLIYLDVWRRDVTALQDPAIREIALGGPDTATRVQTVWQVRVLPNLRGEYACGDDIPGWDALVAPSAGRLTTSTVVPPLSPDPCILSPTGGYRGLENRLYRVEVHVAGTVGGASPAKVKWSRDNASVVSGVNAVSAPGGLSTVVTLTSLGKDRVLRFQAGDWVEILDDYTEFAGASGFMTKVVAPPDEANRTITVTPPIPAGMFDPTNTQRHTRVRRWDERSTGAGSDVDPATGLIDVTAGPLDVEDGIQVSFSADPAGGQLKVGDYWLFAARTADGSVELLQNAPPRGILHHYARLGFLTWAADGSGSFANCRLFWPPAASGGGCCTVSVRPEDVTGTTTLQSIIKQFANMDSVTICLQPGVYTLQTPLVLGVQNPNLTLEGCHGEATLQVLQGAEAGFLDGMVVLNQTNGVTLRGLSFSLPVVPFLAAGGKLAGIDPAVLASLGGPQVQTLQNLSVSIGVRLLSCSGLTIRDCGFFFPPGGAPTSSGNFFGVAILAAGPCKGLILENNGFDFEGGTQQSTQEPFQLLVGCAIVPATVIQGVTQGTPVTGQGGAVSATVVTSWNQDVLFRDNFFGSLSAAVLIYSETDAIVFEDNTVNQCYSGFWVLGRRTPPSLQPFTSPAQQAVPEDLIQDPVFELGCTIARSYPLPAAYNDPSVQVSLSNVTLTSNTSPFPAGSLLANFDVLLQFVSAMETAAAANSKPAGLHLSLRCSNNNVDAEAIDVNLGSTGGGLVVWGDEQDSSTDLILCVNRIKNNTTVYTANSDVYISTVTIVLVTLCTLTGNLILNESNNSPAGSLFLLLNPTTQTSGMAVTGNVLQGGDNLPNNWKSFNAEL